MVISVSHIVAGIVPSGLCGVEGNIDGQKGVTYSCQNNTIRALLGGGKILMVRRVPHMVNRIVPSPIRARLRGGKYQWSEACHT